MENLKKYDVSFHAAVMTFSKNTQLLERLRSIDKTLAGELEIEEVMIFPHVHRDMERRKILQRIRALC